MDRCDKFILSEYIIQIEKDINIYIDEWISTKLYLVAKN